MSSPTLEPDGDWLALPIADPLISQVGVNQHGFVLSMWSNEWFHFDDVVRVLDGTGGTVIDRSERPGDQMGDPMELAPTLALVGQAVASVKVSLDGQLHLETKEGWQIDAGSHSGYSNWRIGLPPDIELESTPGGVVFMTSSYPSAIWANGQLDSWDRLLRRLKRR